LDVRRNTGLREIFRRWDERAWPLAVISMLALSTHPYPGASLSRSAMTVIGCAHDLR